MKKLTLTFLNEQDKRVNMIPKVVNQDLEGPVVKEAMEMICTLDIFEKNGEKLYVEPHTAFYTETIITPLV
ncbi:DUF2922 domain-containing protein [Vagococcus jeotgali]|uniref:DUF2922 domain-containing protein n=1 Tax=Vagococcus jeotgali TaxID=3109030 RepID=UPI002DDB9611|nr:DUF2922 domain-containing protein [Vagococcus sp. B2T-5]